MSVPTSENALKEYLTDHDAHYKELMDEHHRYEERLVELSTIHYPSTEEQIEEATLKKKKLYLKARLVKLSTLPNPMVVCLSSIDVHQVQG